MDDERTDLPLQVRNVHAETPPSPFATSTHPRAGRRGRCCRPTPPYADASSLPALTNPENRTERGAPGPMRHSPDRLRRSRTSWRKVHPFFLTNMTIESAT